MIYTLWKPISPVCSEKDRCGRAFVVHGNTLRFCWRNVLFSFFFLFPFSSFWVVTRSISRPILRHRIGAVNEAERTYTRRDLNEATYAEYFNPLMLITINSRQATVHGRRCIFFSSEWRSRIEFGRSVSKVHMSRLTNRFRQLRCLRLAEFQMADALQITRVIFVKYDLHLQAFYFICTYIKLILTWISL